MQIVKIYSGENSEMYINIDQIVSIRKFVDKEEMLRISKADEENAKDKVNDMIMQLSEEKPVLDICINNITISWTPDEQKSEYNNINNYTDIDVSDLYEAYYNRINELAKKSVADVQNKENNIILKYEVELINTKTYVINERTYKEILNKIVSL